MFDKKHLVFKDMQKEYIMHTMQNNQELILKFYQEYAISTFVDSVVLTFLIAAYPRRPFVLPHNCTADFKMHFSKYMNELTSLLALFCCYMYNHRNSTIYETCTCT